MSAWHRENPELVGTEADLWARDPRLRSGRIVSGGCERCGGRATVWVFGCRLCGVCHEALKALYDKATP